MIQGGDPTGTGKGGSSIWGTKFNDEIRESLRVSSQKILRLQILAFLLSTLSTSLVIVDLCYLFMNDVGSPIRPSLAKTERSDQT